jgi:hypothetical protein
MTITFNMFGAPTTLSYPLTDPELPGFSMTAQVIHRLSFLRFDFISPSELSNSVAFPALTFPKIKPTSNLWHLCFGQLGMDATREALTKDYAVGIQYTGPFTHEHCVACIIEKTPNTRIRTMVTEPQRLESYSIWTSVDRILFKHQMENTISI